MNENMARQTDEGREGVAMGSAPKSPQWRVAHEQLGRLARRRAGLDAEEGRWLLVARRERVHSRLGYGSFGEYVGVGCWSRCEEIHST